MHLPRALVPAIAFLSVALVACSTKPGASREAPAATGEAARPPSPARAPGSTEAPELSPTAAEQPPEPSALADSAMPVTMNLDDADGAELMQMIHQIARKPLKVDPAAQPILDCVVVTVRSGRVTPSEAVRAVAAALRPKGLLVTETARAIEVRRAPDAKPCSHER